MARSPAAKRRCVPDRPPMRTAAACWVIRWETSDRQLSTKARAPHTALERNLFS